MAEENFMETGRLEAFYDAIIAIIVTVLVLELPQPASPSLAAIWALKTNYFAYFISFLVCFHFMAEGFIFSASAGDPTPLR